MGSGGIPARGDACWENAAWRTQTLRDIKQRHNLKHADIGRIIGRAEATVRMWAVGDPRPIPTHALRVLLLDLAGEVQS